MTISLKCETCAAAGVDPFAWRGAPGGQVNKAPQYPKAAQDYLMEIEKAEAQSIALFHRGETEKGGLEEDSENGPHTVTIGEWQSVASSISGVS